MIALSARRYPHRRKQRRHRLGGMTVGVAAVAGRNRNDRRADRGYPTEAIVMIADRRLTYDDNSVTETWVPKIRGIIGQGSSVRTTWSALFAGDGSMVDEIKAEIVSDSIAKQRLHEHPEWPPMDEVVDAVRQAMAKVWRRGFVDYVYPPFGLTPALVVERSQAVA